MVDHLINVRQTNNLQASNDECHLEVGDLGLSLVNYLLNDFQFR